MARALDEVYAPPPVPNFREMVDVERFLADELHRISAALAPGLAKIESSTLNVDLALSEPNWVKLTADLTHSGLPVGIEYNYQTYISNQADNEARVDTGLGFSGAPPIIAITTDVLTVGASKLVSESGVNLTARGAGSLALWARCQRQRSGGQFSGVWTYKRTSGAPGSGEVNHYDTGDRLRFNTTDKDGIDQTANLSNMNIGDFITGPGQSWEVTAVNGVGDFDVTPPIRIANEGDYSFSFNYGVPATGPVWVLGGVTETYLAIGG